MFPVPNISLTKCFPYQIACSYQTKWFLAKCLLIKEFTNQIDLDLPLIYVSNEHQKHIYCNYVGYINQMYAIS